MELPAEYLTSVVPPLQHEELVGVEHVRISDDTAAILAPQSNFHYEFSKSVADFLVSQDDFWKLLLVNPESAEGELSHLLNGESKPSIFLDYDASALFSSGADPFGSDISEVSETNQREQLVTLSQIQGRGSKIKATGGGGSSRSSRSRSVSSGASQGYSGNKNEPVDAKKALTWFLWRSIIGAIISGLAGAVIGMMNDRLSDSLIFGSIVGFFLFPLVLAVTTAVL